MIQKKMKNLIHHVVLQACNGCCKAQSAGNAAVCFVERYVVGAYFSQISVRHMEIIEVLINRYTTLSSFYMLISVCDDRRVKLCVIGLIIKSWFSTYHHLCQ